MIFFGRHFSNDLTPDTKPAVNLMNKFINYVRRVAGDVAARAPMYSREHRPETRRHFSVQIAPMCH